MKKAIKIIFGVVISFMTLLAAAVAVAALTYDEEDYL